VLNVDEPGPQFGPLLGLQGKAALVVGGGFGIGRSAARMLAAQGARLALVDLDAERVKAASRELSAFGLRADVREPGAARAAVRDASAELGGLDILVNIVGRGLAARAADVTAAMQREVLETNYRTTWSSAPPSPKPRSRTAGPGRSPWSPPWPA
jgi:meso-butanediol dehydrogenase/(S,S)-butanediol dehydrogenase/diacetyl reductase